MTAPIYILGGAQTDFSLNWSREGKGIEQVMRCALEDALEATNLTYSDIQTTHVGNFAAELFCRQGQLGGLFASLDKSLSGKPATRHEAACASGSMAALGAMAEIQAGRYDLACVMGIEYMRNVPGQRAAEHLGCAAWAGEEWDDATYLWPRAFSDLADVYSERFGEIAYDHIGAIAQKNYKNARKNPNAQTRMWEFQNSSFTENDDTNPVIEGRVRRNDCGQVTDGGAVVFLASSDRAKIYAKDNNVKLEDIPQIQGWGHRTATMRFVDKLAESDGDPVILPHVKGTIQDALSRAGIGNVFDLDLIETHDCFAMTEYMAIDHFGITPPGKSWQAVEEGTTQIGGKLPVNPSGGLIGLGHPVGATGARMLLDAYKQSAGQAGEYQVENARRVGILNIGGSTTTIASFIVGRD